MDTKLWAEIAESTVDETVARFKELEEELRNVNQMLADLTRDNENLEKELKEKNKVIKELYSRIEESFRSFTNYYKIGDVVKHIKKEIGDGLLE